MTERPKPYIGISGVVNEYQQYYLMDQFVWQGLDAEPVNRKISIGVKAVHKTQFLDIENKYGPEWYPAGERSFANALESGGIDALRVAQVYFDPAHVGDLEYQNKFVDRIRQRGKAWLNAIQFDMLPWHQDASQFEFLERFRGETGLSVLLQAHGEAMKQQKPDALVRTLGRYAHALDYVLFDASHGKGVRMDTDALRPFLDAAYSSDELADVGFAVAGGLNATVVSKGLPELIDKYPEISWDAEGQLHPLGQDGTRPLDMARVKDYFEASSEVLRDV